jgi:group I intron endonuclease
MIHIDIPPFLSGIYKTISPSGKIYIGQSVNLKKRKKCYETLQCKLQPKIYSSLLKYGWENHIWEEKHFPIYMLNEMEINFKKEIIEYFGWEKALFCDIYDSGGGPRSQQTKNKMSISGLGVPQPLGFGENISKKLKGREVTWKHKLGGKDIPRTTLRKPVLQMDPNMNYIKEWESIKQAEIEYGKDQWSDNIGACCRGKQKTAYGFIWKYI